jgi:hypothetical protein
MVVTEPWIDAAWIRDQLHETRKTQRALAEALKLDPSAISRLLEGARKIKPHEIPPIIAFFGGPEVPQRSVGRESAATSDLGPAPREASWQIDQPDHYRTKPGPRPKAKPATELPVLGPLIPERNGSYFLEERVTERRPSPPQLLGVSGAYALFVPDDQLAPRYLAGEVIYIHPHKPPIAGSFAVIRFREPKGRVAIGELTFSDPMSLGLRIRSGDPRRPFEDLTFRLADIGQVGRIVVAATE